MKISEVKDGVSLKYEAITITGKTKEPYTLIGMFMELPTNFIKEGREYHISGKFIGYIKGSGQLQELSVSFYNSDEDANKAFRDRFSQNDLPININRLSATRMPKVISDHLKKLHKQYQEESKLQENLRKLDKKSKIAKENINTLTRTIAEDLKREVKTDYKSLPDSTFYLNAAKLFSKYKHRNNITDFYLKDEMKPALTIEVCLPGYYPEHALYLIKKKITLMK